MNALKMRMIGDDANGWTWSVTVDGEDIFCTSPLARDDIAEALFSIQRDSSRTNDLFEDVADEELFLILDGYFFGSLCDVLNTPAEEQTWAKHLVTPIVPTKIHSRIYLIGTDGAGEDRLLVWQEGRRRNFRIVAGEFDEQLRRSRSVLE